MKRGVLELDKQEINLIRNLLIEDRVVAPQLLLEKLKISSDEIKENFTVEFSEEDIEIILDIIPISNPLRAKIQQFMFKLRS